MAQNVRSHEILVKSFTFWALRNSQQLFTVTDTDAEVPMCALSISEFLPSLGKFSLAGSVFVKFSVFCVFVLISAALCLLIIFRVSGVSFSRV